MFYDLGLKIAFIHVPRTAGVAITLAFKPHLGHGSGWDLANLRHLSYHGMTTKLRLQKEPIRFFTVFRPFSDIVESYRRLIERDKQLLLTGTTCFSEAWKSILLTDDPIEETFRRTGWPTEENAWWRFWLGHANSKIRTLNFHTIEHDLAELCRDWNLPPIKLAAEKVN